MYQQPYTAISCKTCAYPGSIALIGIIDELKAKGAAFRPLTEQMDTPTP